METKFNFKSQICTSIEQSRRLLELGLKKETADMHYSYLRTNGDYELTATAYADLLRLKDRMDNRKILGMGWDELYGNNIPAWSLHRIISMVYSSRAKKNGLGLAIVEYENPFEDMIRQIEWLIKEGYFNKQYLEE